MTQALAAGLADGVIISPFHTPRVSIPRHQAGATVSAAVIAAGGEAVFDASTHARLLPGSDDVLHYDTWQLWGPSGIGLDSDAKRLEHLERVFARQREMSVPTLAPTLTLESPLGQAADDAFRTAELARGLDPACWQTLAGRRSFWRAGSDLDAYIGQLASLRAPCWALTVVNDIVVDNVPDLADTEAFSGLLRTVHSLSQRARVIICHADYAGVPAVAAGASDIGAGWDRGMRFFDPRSFQLTTPGIQIPASYVTQGRLGAVLRRDTGDAIARLGDAFATTLRGGPMPADDTAERSHHLRQLRDLVNAVSGHGVARPGRIGELRNFYERSMADFDSLLTRLPRTTLQESSRMRWVEQPYRALKAYAEAEGLWL
ncbi:hypothetical protein [Geodermatophilus ruber]|uniref:hypothetical protein n=1 Tax=Geodermatophilus ruber TaxID=504800 RepID=UPI001160AC6E|nr:hypothetical protein [Geodermatophilus ruber]